MIEIESNTKITYFLALIKVCLGYNLTLGFTHTAVDAMLGWQKKHAPDSKNNYV